MTHPSPPSLRLRWQRAWGQRPPKERNLIALGAGLALALVYGLALYPLAAKRIDKLSYDLEKLAVRSKGAAKADAAPLAAPPGLGGMNPAQAERELQELQRQLEDTTAELRTLQSQFVALDDSLAMNALKTGLTTLAEAGDMEVTAIEHVVPRAEDKDRPPTPELLRTAAQANPFKRPLVQMRARASFRGLMQFLDGLHQLPYIAAPVASSVTVVVERHPQTQAPLRQWLDVRIKFAV
ncbi:MAG: hypothetical protein ACT4NV_12315 [Rhodoferax sp.]